MTLNKIGIHNLKLGTDSVVDVTNSEERRWVATEEVNKMPLKGILLYHNILILVSFLLT
jgi:hypothetical protein